MLGRLDIRPGVGAGGALVCWWWCWCWGPSAGAWCWGCPGVQIVVLVLVLGCWVGLVCRWWCHIGYGAFACAPRSVRARASVHV